MAWHLKHVCIHIRLKDVFHKENVNLRIAQRLITEQGNFMDGKSHFFTNKVKLWQTKGHWTFYMHAFVTFCTFPSHVTGQTDPTHLRLEC